MRALLMIGLLFSNFLWCNLRGAEITRVIVSCDTNPKYIQFWPLVAAAWKQLVGIRPTLILIADDDFPIDTSCGDVIRFKPIPDVPTSLQAQTIRLLAGYYYPGETYIISDIDMIPCSKSYFLDPVKTISSDHFVVYKAKYDGVYPMCYNVMRGTTSMEIFGGRSIEEIRKVICEWYQEGWGWNTDQIILTRIITEWARKTHRVHFLQHGIDRRVDRLHWEQKGNWGINMRLLQRGGYVDAHLLRPFEDYREENMIIVRGLNIQYP